jgi:hypothetical protein
MITVRYINNQYDRCVSYFDSLKTARSFISALGLEWVEWVILDEKNIVLDKSQKRLVYLEGEMSA